MFKYTTETTKEITGPIESKNLPELKSETEQTRLVQEKIALLKDHGYELCGALPDCTSFSKMQETWGALLFTRNGAFYQYQLKAFYSKELPSFDLNPPSRLATENLGSKPRPSVPQSPAPSLSDKGSTGKMVSALTNASETTASTNTESFPLKIHVPVAPNPGVPATPGSNTPRVMSQPFALVPGQNSMQNKGLIYVITREMNSINPSLPPKYILFVKETTLSFHNRLVGIYTNRPPLLYMNNPYEELNQKEIEAQVSQLNCYPKSAYILTQNKLVFVKIIDNKVCYEPLEIPSAALNSLMPTTGRDKETTLQKNIDADFLKFLAKEAPKHTPILHECLGGEFYCDTEGKILFFDPSSGGFEPKEETCKNFLKQVFKPALVDEKFVNVYSAATIEAELRKRLGLGNPTPVPVTAEAAEEVSTQTNSGSDLPQTENTPQQNQFSSF